MKEKGKTMPDFETVGTLVACVIIFVLLIVVGVLQLRAHTSMNVTGPPWPNDVTLPPEAPKVGQVLSFTAGEGYPIIVGTDGVITWPIEGKDVLRLEPTGGPAFRLVVMYDGAERGELLRVEYGSGARTVSLPNRPPHGWMIGGIR